jgi:hypothetical protein
MATKLIDMVNFLFSKNAGPFLITFDILFKDDRNYNRACSSGVFTRERIAILFKIQPERIVSMFEYAAANTIKFTITRDISSGEFGDSSVFGSQMWAPLIDLEVNNT